MMSGVPLDASVPLEQTSRLLWESCRRDPDPIAVRHALTEGADTGLAVAAAAKHGIVALLWRALGVAEVRDALGPEATVLRAVSDACRMEALLLIPHAVALSVQPLTEAGLEPVIFKGPAVAGCYPEPGLRPMGDIDLLLPVADHARALKALRRAQWQVVRTGGAGHYDTQLVHSHVPSLSLELHYGLEPSSERVTALDPAALWERRVPLDCAGTPAFGLASADELVVLAAHAGKPFHGFTRLMWIADIAMVVGDAVADGSAMDWDAVHAAAEEARCLRVVGAALELARRVGVDAPSEYFPLPTHGWRGRTLRQLLSVTWPLTAHELHRYHLTYALTDAPTQRVRSLLALVGKWHGLKVRVQTMGGLLRHPMWSERQDTEMPSRFRYAPSEARHPEPVFD
jgi:hypothetical protein